MILSLKEDEWNQLEKNILAEACKEPLIVWQNKETNEYILVDGHNRYGICRKHSLTFAIEVRSFRDYEQVKEWMIDHQLGRRNLTAEQMSYLRGQKYESLKMQGKRNDLTSPQNDAKSKTSKKLAKAFKVGERTIERDTYLRKVWI